MGVTPSALLPWDQGQDQEDGRGAGRAAIKSVGSLYQGQTSHSSLLLEQFTPTSILQIWLPVVYKSIKLPQWKDVRVNLVRSW